MKFLPLLCLAFVSCASSDFIAYEGEQMQWKTAPGAFAKSGYAVPVYYGPPSRPYVLLGYIDAKTAPVRRTGVVKYAAQKAKEAGGDAIIVTSEGSEYQGTVSTGSANTSVAYNSATTTFTGSSVPLYSGRAGALVIRFK